MTNVNKHNRLVNVRAVYTCMELKVLIKVYGFWFCFSSMLVESGFRRFFMANLSSKNIFGPNNVLEFFFPRS